GTLYPIIDANSALMNKMNISYFPTLYVIFPDRTVYEISTGLSAVGMYNYITTNKPNHQATTGGIDADIISPYNGTTETCGSLTVPVRVQNKGDRQMPA